VCGKFSIVIQELTTKIDDRYRPGALNGLVEPGERYHVQKISDTELRFRRLVVAEPPPCRLEMRTDGLVLVSDKVLTGSEVAKVLEEFP